METRKIEIPLLIPWIFRGSEICQEGTKITSEYSIYECQKFKKTDNFVPSKRYILAALPKKGFTIRINGNEVILVPTLKRSWPWVLLFALYCGVPFILLNFIAAGKDFLQSEILVWILICLVFSLVVLLENEIHENFLRKFHQLHWLFLPLTLFWFLLILSYPNIRTEFFLGWMILFNVFFMGTVVLSLLRIELSKRIPELALTTILQLILSFIAEYMIDY